MHHHSPHFSLVNVLVSGTLNKLIISYNLSERCSVLYLYAWQRLSSVIEGLPENDRDKLNFLASLAEKPKA